MDRNIESTQPLDNPNFNVVHSFVMEVLVRLCNDVHISINDRNNANDIVIAAEDYIAKHVHRPLPVTELAQVCHISTRQLRRIIRKEYDKTIKQWILDKKLNMARTYLDMQYAVKETASICGFSDPNYFPQIFKKQYDLTPSEYKKQYIN